MAHFGIFTPPVSGHLHPFGALGRELKRRGHRVTVFQFPDFEEKTRAESLAFVPVGASEFPRGTTPRLFESLGELSGLRALRFTIDMIRRETLMFCREGPDAVRSAGLEMLLVDQTEPAGALVAERCGLPFATLCMALALHRENTFPPPFMHGLYSTGAFSRILRAGEYKLWDAVTRPVRKVLFEYAATWNLKLSSRAAPASQRLQMSQQIPEFDFPRRSLPPVFHYVGPLRDQESSRAEFPWDRLDGRPLIYASLGTLQGAKLDVFLTIAEACRSLPVQLVISHGNALSPEAVRRLPGKPLVVSYAPQPELLAQACLTVTHAGLNTVLDSLSRGVPLIAIPITYEQPGIGARLRWSGAGKVVQRRRLTVERLRQAIQDVMDDPSFRRQAERLRASIQQAGGTVRAADLIETALRTGQPVVR